MQKDFDSFFRFAKLNDGRFKEPNAYYDWNFKDAVKHDILIKWTELDKRSAEYSEAKVIVIEMMIESMYANSRLLDQDHYYEGNILDLFNVETVGIELTRLHEIWKNESIRRRNLENHYEKENIPNTVNPEILDLPLINNDDLRAFLKINPKTLSESIKYFKSNQK